MRAAHALFLTFGLLVSAGCASEKAQINTNQDHPFIDPEDPFAIPHALYQSHPQGEDAHILHPADFLGSLSTLPDTECDKEKLRRLVIAMNMYSLDMMNQTYYVETSTPGVKILETVYPDIEKLYGEGGRAINIGVLSEHLRDVKIDCPGLNGFRNGKT